MPLISDEAKRQARYLDATFLGKFAGSSTVILAGGPSVASVNLTQLRCDGFIAVNVVNYMERFVAVRHRFMAGLALDEDLALKINLNTKLQRKYPLFVGSLAGMSESRYMRDNAQGLFRIPSQYTSEIGSSFGSFHIGSNSGFAAVQLAVLLGFSRIGLLGYDGPPASGGPAHFHNEYSAVIDPYPIEWCGYLDGHSAEFKVMGIEVINLSLLSHLTAYTKLSLEEWNSLGDVDSRSAVAHHPADAISADE